jgi:gliding motility-associated-like protein
VIDTSNNGFQIIPEYSDPTIVRLNHNYKDQIIINGGFSPNYDEINDELSIFIPNGITIEFIHFFNRWGVKIAEFDDTDRVGNLIIWNGQIGNETSKYKVEEGTYFYTYKIENDPKVYANFITVKK